MASLSHSDQIATILDSDKNNSSVRFIFLKDIKTNLWAYTLFSYPYDTPASKTALSQLFDITFDTLVSCEKTFFTDTDLPFLKYVGRGQITFVYKNLDNSIDLREGFDSLVDGHIGMEKFYSNKRN